MLILYIIIEHCTYYISGDVENAVEHLSNAVPLCGQPQQLLQVLEQTLPPQVFQLLVQKLPEVNKVMGFTAEAFIEKWCESWCPSQYTVYMLVQNTSFACMAKLDMSSTFDLAFILQNSKGWYRFKKNLHRQYYSNMF